MKRFTDEELDQLCGGAPSFTFGCSQSKCKTTKGPYYSRALAADAIREHEEWGHLRTLGSSVASGNAGRGGVMQRWGRVTPVTIPGRAGVVPTCGAGRVVRGREGQRSAAGR
jgi:hypothetical protein